MEEAKPNVKTATAEAEMKAVVADINKAPKGEDMLCPRECDRKEEKELVPMTVEWGYGGGTILSSSVVGQGTMHK